ncbi:hypothetical protein PPL_08882 [Heterostelium album PN500]|uniref:Uncharacterized protein n=1 Tax=Heterostelium pallidum (strain ATCC 26659 / Pp 5 / PN500) TaxID=670386 RepID=D3BK01_HETP5|nr:hypothetical protein PPL_08882 [Heterostelium album PN500]EFA78231.1 hypothetical protein PPL_08882 [Heterostelium album PN500]|eukprot:XP_020430356.1 hypothetical protein PPL_08882 [Heterostelium album PN500]
MANFVNSYILVRNLGRLSYARCSKDSSECKEGTNLLNDSLSDWMGTLLPLNTNFGTRFGRKIVRRHFDFLLNTTFWICVFQMIVCQQFQVPSNSSLNSKLSINVMLYNNYQLNPKRHSSLSY